MYGQSTERAKRRVRQLERFSERCSAPDAWFINAGSRRPQASAQRARHRQSAEFCGAGVEFPVRNLKVEAPVSEILACNRRPLRVLRRH